MNQNMNNQILGRLQGLAEAWGETQSEWEPKQESRIKELYQLLHPAFVVSVFSNGLKSDRLFLRRIGAELYNNGEVVI